LVHQGWFSGGIPVAARADGGVGPALIGFLTVTFVCGCSRRGVQLAHVVDITHFSGLDDEDIHRIEQEWALCSTVSTRPTCHHAHRFVSWLLGGTSTQVEHLPVPRVSHVALPSISELVRETCGSSTLLPGNILYAPSIYSHLLALLKNAWAAASGAVARTVRVTGRAKRYSRGNIGENE
jgi:fatty acid desaturase